MRIVTWNLGYMLPGPYKARANRQRQWETLVGDLRPDVALLQECRPDDLGLVADAARASEYEVVGKIPRRWIACSAVLARRGLGLAWVPPPGGEGDAAREDRWLGHLSGYVCRAEVTLPHWGRVRVASVHTTAEEVGGDILTEEEHARYRRGTSSRAWRNDLAVAALSHWLGERFVVGGDWNTARAFDERYAARWGPAGREFFERAAAMGWAETLRAHHAAEVQTYFGARSGPYQLDHLFTDGALHGRLRQAAVVEALARAGLSDHAPLVADYDLRP